MFTVFTENVCNFQLIHNHNRKQTMEFSLSMKTALSCAAVFLAAGICSAADPLLTSPDADKTIRVYLDEGNVLRVERNDSEVFKVRLGLKSDKAEYDFSKLQIRRQIPSAVSPVLVSEKYTSVNGKRSDAASR